MSDTSSTDTSTNDTARNDDEFVEEAAALVERFEAMRGEDRIAAACRGSANPAALQWLVDTLGLTADHRVADLGAGLGGPAAWVRARVGCEVVAADPSPTAAAGALRLFGPPAVQAGAATAPFADDAFDAVLLLGVLSVVDDRLATVGEAHRVGRCVGVLDYCSTTGATVAAGGSEFATADQLAAEIGTAWEHVSTVRVDTPTPDDWARAAERAQAGVPEPPSEREVAEAIESGRLALYALVGAPR